MVLGISLIIASFIALIYGISKKNRALIFASVILLIVIFILWIIYLYLYSLTPH